MLTNELKAEIEKLKNYDGPAFPGWTSEAVGTSLSAFNAYLGAELEEHRTELYQHVAWAFEQGLFPELSKLLVITADSYSWRDNVPLPLRKEIAAECAAQVKIVHSYRTRPRR